MMMQNNENPNEAGGPLQTFLNWVNGTEKPVDEKPERDQAPEGHNTPSDLEDNEVYGTDTAKGKVSVITRARNSKRRFESLKKIYIALAAIFCCIAVGLLLFTVVSMPPYGSSTNPTSNEVAQRYIEQGPSETGATNTVAGMILDYRAFDTFGESTVLFVSTAMVMVLMKKNMNEPDEAGDLLLAEEEAEVAKDQNIVLKLVSNVLVPITMLFGIYVVLNGQVSPGGGFSGGAIIGGSLILYALAFGSKGISKVITYRFFTLITSGALLTYAAIKGYSFFTGANHLPGSPPLGNPGAILSGGFILPLNICVGIIVAFTMYGFFALFSKGDV